MKKKNNKGFSLIELIIAIAILVILTGLLAPQFMRYMEKSREAKDMQTLDTIYGAAQVAIADEAAYKDLKSNTKLTAIGTTGMTLTNLIKVADVDSAFMKEMRATCPSFDSITWNSKAAADAKGNDATYILINPTTLKVSVWMGKISSGGAVDDTYALNSETEALTGVKTTGTTFYISK